MSARLWVTGLGLVTPLGAGVEATWKALLRGDCAIGPVTLFDASDQRVDAAAEVRDVVLPGPVELWSRTSAMALAAADEAMRAAALDARAARVGLVIGGTTGGMFETEPILARLHAQPGMREPIRAMLAHPLTATGDRLDERLGPFARIRTLASACSSGANALIVAACWLRSGEVDAVVAGGADALCRLTLSGFNALAAIDPEACRPFDRRRRGTRLGEGAGFLVLERVEGARRRGVVPIAELAGWATGAEAHHVTNPAADGALVAELIGRAVARAGFSPNEIDYVSAHGTGTPLNDAMEAAALRRALGADMDRIAVSSSKGQIGHTLGAAGAIHAAVTALVVARRKLVPTVGLEELDPGLVLVNVPRVGGDTLRVRAALSNAFGFGGMDAVLVFSEPDFGAPSAGEGARTPGDAAAVVITGAAIFGRRGLLGVRECARLGENEGAFTSLDPDAHLDVVRARRLDGTGRLGAVAVQQALAEAGADPRATGVVLGGAFGNLDASAAFLDRVLAKGARAASPAEFPNLVPSSAVGHVSIYLGMQGPAFATADLATSGESAFAQVSQFVRTGETSSMVAGAAECGSDIVDRVLAPLFEDAPAPPGTVRTDLAAAVVVERRDRARADAKRELARVAVVLEWREDAAVALAALHPPRGDRAEVVMARADRKADELLLRAGWAACPRVLCEPALGESDVLGAAALAVAAARIGEGRATEVLVLGLARARGYAVVLSAP